VTTFEETLGDLRVIEESVAVLHQESPQPGRRERLLGICNHLRILARLWQLEGPDNRLRRQIQEALAEGATLIREWPVPPGPAAERSEAGTDERSEAGTDERSEAGTDERSEAGTDGLVGGPGQTAGRLTE
jgi:hypothetical protein